MRSPSLSHESGFFNFVLHPNFAQNGYLYALYMWTANGNDIPRDFAQSNGFVGLYLRLSRFTVDLQNLTINPNTEQVMFHIRLVNGSHRGGGMVFDDDGYLYLAIGEMFDSSRAQNISNNFAGGVIRIDVDSQGGAVSHAPIRKMGMQTGFGEEFSGVGYFIPDDNPFNNPAGTVFEEFYEVGHRNPYRMSYDPPTGQIWISEAGDLLEEVSLLDRNGGGNGMWPFYEGLDPNPGSSPPGLLGTENPAVLEIPRTEARAAIGGHVYRGLKFAGLVGKFFMGDFTFGTLWAATYDDQTDLATTEIISSLPFVAGFGEDPYNGEIYMFDSSSSGTFVTGLSKLSGGLTGTIRDAPATLSETGAFTNLTTLDPVAGLYPFEPIAPLWSDGAAKKRWVAIPQRGAPRFSAVRTCHLLRVGQL